MSPSEDGTEHRRTRRHKGGISETQKLSGELTEEKFLKDSLLSKQKRDIKPVPGLLGEGEKVRKGEGDIE